MCQICPQKTRVPVGGWSSWRKNQENLNFGGWTNRLWPFLTMQERRNHLLSWLTWLFVFLFFFRKTNVSSPFFLPAYRSLLRNHQSCCEVPFSGWIREGHSWSWPGHFLSGLRDFIPLIKSGRPWFIKKKKQSTGSPWVTTICFVTVWSWFSHFRAMTWLTFGCLYLWWLHHPGNAVNAICKVGGEVGKEGRVLRYWCLA